MSKMTNRLGDEQISRLKRSACDAIDAAAPQLHQLSQSIWNNPELNYQEHHAHKILSEYMKTKIFNVQQSYHIETAFRAEPLGTQNCLPSIAFLCEYDALPEIGHACGHNLIAEVGVAAGLGVQAVLDEIGYDKARLTVLGCPAEESGGGKIELIKAGAFREIDVAMMAHPANTALPRGKMLACQWVIVTYQGKASHASETPWEGVNALDAAVMAYSAISSMRQQFKPTWEIHGVISKGGAKANIIPQTTELTFCMRAPIRGELKPVMEKFKMCCDGAAVATGCQVSFEWDKNPYDNMLVNKTLAELYVRNAENLGKKLDQGEGAGSSDMCNVSHVVPSIHPCFTIGTDAPLHTREFCRAAGEDVAQEPTLQEAKLLAMTAVDIICQPQLLERIKEDFQEDMRREHDD